MLIVQIMEHKIDQSVLAEFMFQQNKTKKEMTSKTFKGRFLSLPEGLITPFFFNDSSDTSSPSMKPAASMSFKLTGTNLGNPACMPRKKGV